MSERRYILDKNLVIVDKNRGEDILADYEGEPLMHITKHHIFITTTRRDLKVLNRIKLLTAVFKLDFVVYSCDGAWRVDTPGNLIIPFTDTTRIDRTPPPPSPEPILPTVPVAATRPNMLSFMLGPDIKLFIDPKAEVLEAEWHHTTLVHADPYGIILDFIPPMDSYFKRCMNLAARAFGLHMCVYAWKKTWVVDAPDGTRPRLLPGVCLPRGEIKPISEVIDKLLKINA